MAWFKSGYKQTDTKDMTVSFTQSGTRENIRSGEKHKTLFGKIAKYFSDLKPVAFSGSYNDLQDKPSNLVPAAHRHSKSDITDFPSSMPASDVYGWAKASSKPAYTAAEVGALPVTGGTVTGDTIIQKVVTTNVTMGRGVIYFAGDTSKDTSNNYLLFSPDWGTQNAVIVMRQTFRPVASGYMYLGDSSHRWNQVYAVNGTIQTSDRNEKEEISYIGQESSYEDTNMTDEQLIQLILGLKPVVFKRINGESGRPHHGIIAQDFEELMEEIGLYDHAAFIKSPKTREFETEKEVEKEVTKKDGTKEVIKETIKEVHQEEIPGEYTRGLRYEEFIPDMARFGQILYQQNQEHQKKIEDLENRMEILEDIIKQGA